MAHRIDRESSRSRTPIRRLRGSPRAIDAERAAGALAAKWARQDAARMADRGRPKAEQQVPEPVLSAPVLALARASELVEAAVSESDDFSPTSHSSFSSSSSSSFGDTTEASWRSWRGGSAPGLGSATPAHAKRRQRQAGAAVRAPFMLVATQLCRDCGPPPGDPATGRTQTNKLPCQHHHRQIHHHHHHHHQIIVLRVIIIVIILITIIIVIIINIIVIIIVTIIVLDTLAAAVIINIITILVAVMYVSVSRHYRGIDIIISIRNASRQHYQHRRRSGGRVPTATRATRGSHVSRCVRLHIVSEHWPLAAVFLLQGSGLAVRARASARPMEMTLESVSVRVVPSRR